MKSTQFQNVNTPFLESEQRSIKDLEHQPEATCPIEMKKMNEIMLITIAHVIAILTSFEKLLSLPVSSEPQEDFRNVTSKILLSLIKQHWNIIQTWRQSSTPQIPANQEAISTKQHILGDLVWQLSQMELKAPNIKQIQENLRKECPGLLTSLRIGEKMPQPGISKANVATRENLTTSPHSTLSDNIEQFLQEGRISNINSQPIKHEAFHTLPSWDHIYSGIEEVVSSVKIEGSQEIEKLQEENDKLLCTFQQRQRDLKQHLETVQKLEEDTRVLSNEKRAMECQLTNKDLEIESWKTRAMNKNKEINELKVTYRVGSLSEQDHDSKQQTWSKSRRRRSSLKRTIFGDRYEPQLPSRSRLSDPMLCVVGEKFRKDVDRENLISVDVIGYLQNTVIKLEIDKNKFASQVASRTKEIQSLSEVIKKKNLLIQLLQVGLQRARYEIYDIREAISKYSKKRLCDKPHKGKCSKDMLPLHNRVKYSKKEEKLLQTTLQNLKLAIDNVDKAHVELFCNTLDEGGTTAERNKLPGIVQKQDGWQDSHAPKRKKTRGPSIEELVSDAQVALDKAINIRKSLQGS